MKRIEELPDVMTAPQVAKFLGISSGTCYEMIARGEIPAKKLGRRVLISKRELATYLGYGGVPKLVPKVPAKVIFEVAELARAMAEATERLARICQEIGGEYGGQSDLDRAVAPGVEKSGATPVSATR